ncbi:MAG: aminodeoxychorismate synthase component I [Acidobacteria bacterium]|nr:aminodeoxychorismate synthase component I [Acidobacteriota bacterium]
MNFIEITSPDLVDKLLGLSITDKVCILDSCDVGHQGSHLLIAGIDPVETIEISGRSVDESFEIFDETLSRTNLAAVFSLAYDFGLKIENIARRSKEYRVTEPDIFISLFDCLIIHDYQTGKTRIGGDPKRSSVIAELLRSAESIQSDPGFGYSDLRSNFTEREYLDRVNSVLEYIRNGDTYQTNITQQFRAQLYPDLSPQHIFKRLRKRHPAPFSAFLSRKNDHVISISPERFISAKNGVISAAPIKGTRKRGSTKIDDANLRIELSGSEKDRAENTMIVDLLRNDLGRICEFGSVKVNELCAIEEHPTIFHLVSNISGVMRKHLSWSDVVRATFPCGSITGCPKIRTMEIIDKLETADRGLSMGAIGYRGFDQTIDLSVAIRTMVIREDQAIFNVGGGIVIDSDPLSEYRESNLKAKALIEALSSRPSK